jgi:hypothetical protein
VNKKTFQEVNAAKLTCVKIEMTFKVFAAFVRVRTECALISFDV